MSIDNDYRAVCVRAVPEGMHRARIVSARKDRSQKNNDMIVVEFEIYNYTPTVKYYIVFIDNNPQIAGRKLTDLFRAFPSIANEQDTSRWAGAVGAVMLSYEDYDGSPRLTVSSMVPERMQVGLPDFGGGKAVIYDDVVYVPASEAKSFQQVLRETMAAREAAENA